MEYEYYTKRVCSKKITFDIDNGVVTNIKFYGGCNGNTKGVSQLADGMTPDEIISKLSGLKCLIRGTSCPDQLARALKEIKEKNN